MRSIWSGSVSFGLVNIPVKLQSAVQTEEIDFDMLSKEDLAPIRYARVDSKTGEEVEWKDIVKGYQYAKGKYVVVTEEDFEKASPAKSKVIDIIRGLRNRGHQVTVHDPLAYPAETAHEYQVDLNADALDHRYDAVICAVAHDLYSQMTPEQIEQLVTETGVIADLKGIWRKKTLSAPLSRWTL